MFSVYVGGQSASGKTGVAQHLKDELIASGVGAQIINMDDYYLECPPNVDVTKFRLETNFDKPDMLHFELFKEHILDLHQGKSIVKPLFDFATNKRKGQETINPSEVIIVEGIFAQYFHDTFLPSDLPSLTVNVATDSYLDIIKRRIERDIVHRGRKKEDVLAQEKKFVGPGFLKYTAPHAHADIHINNMNKDTPEEQDALLKKAAIEISEKIKFKKALATSGKIQPRKAAPDVQKMVAKSHIMAGNFNNPTRFYNGVFGANRGNYKYTPTPREQLIYDLEKYIQRIEMHRESKRNDIDFKYNFWFFKNSRALNRQANYYLAKQLQDNLLNQPKLTIQEIFANTLGQRSKIIVNKGIHEQPNYVERNINSSELNAIINKATQFDENTSQQTSLSV